MRTAGVTDGHGESVGGIIGRRILGQAEEESHHLLHGPFLSRAETRHRLLYFRWRVLGEGRPLAHRRSQGYAARLAHGDGRGHIPRVEERLDRDVSHNEIVPQRTNVVEERPEPDGCRLRWVCGDATVCQVPKHVILDSQNAISKTGQSRVEAKYDA
jgi:hypothetical protein